MNNEIKFISKDKLTERDWFLLSLNSSKDIPQIIQLPSKHFACFITWNSKNASDEEISDLLEVLIKNGAAYICAWGDDCNRVENIADEIDANPDKEFGSPENSVIMTTSHKDESLEEALYFFLTLTFPDEYYEKTLNSNLAISIGNTDWNDSITNIMKNADTVRE